MHRISSHTEDELAAFEQQAEDLMRLALQSVMDQIADRIVAHAQVPVMAAGPPEDTPGQPYVSPDDLSSITPLWRDQVTRMLPLIAEIYQDSGGRVHAGLVEATRLPDLPDAASAAASGYLSQVQNVYDGVGSDLWETARGELVDGFNNGESIDQLAARLRASAGMTARGAVLVARSTVVEASNAGSIATAKASGLDMRKEWIATNDPRTRPTHRTADGQQVDLHASFTVGGFSAEVPGDPGLPGQEKYNCRCTVGYVMANDQAAEGRQVAHDQQAQADLPGTREPLRPTIAEPLGQPAAETAPSMFDELAAEGVVPSQAETIAAERRARRAVIRARSAEIEAAKPYAALSSEVDQLIARRRYEGWSVDLGRQLDQVRIAARGAGIPGDELRAFSDAIANEVVGPVNIAARDLAASRGLTRVGRVGQRVAYDPKTMEPIGEIAYNEGEQVQIWRVGQELRLSDGSTMMLDKSIVRSVNPQPRLAREIMADAANVGRARPRSVGSGLADLRGAVDSAQQQMAVQQALGEEIGEAYVHDFGTFRTAISSSSVSVRNARIDGLVLNANGDEVGTFIRTLSIDNDGKLVANHSSLALDPSVQGSGFAARFNAQMFDYYRNSGVDRVLVFANDDIGGYTWAAQGFDFRDAHAANIFRTDMREKIQQQVGGPNLLGAARRLGVDPDRLQDDLDQFEALLARAENGEQIKAFEFSQVGRQPGQTGREATWLGKFLMLGSSWSGVLPL